MEDFVQLSKNNIHTTSSCKLHLRLLGPFGVMERLSAVSYCLDLLLNLSYIYPILYVIIMKFFTCGGDDRQLSEAVTIIGEEEYIVDK